MILTVTPNTSIDRTYVIEGFGVDRIHRPTEVTAAPGGKGINVLRVFHELGGDGIATGLVGGRVGESIAEGLRREGLAFDFVKTAEESRLCLKIVDPKAGTQTEINEPGPRVALDEVKQLLDKIGQLLVGMEYVVLCGNVPPGVPVTFYGDVITMAKAKGVKSVLDTSGDYLREAIKAGPYIVKPNVAELSELAEHELFTLEEISGAAKSLKQYGVAISAVTMGRTGAVVTDGVRTWQAVPPEIQFASAVGSGDSFIAAFLRSLEAGEPLPGALAMGTAAGAANAMTYGAGFCSKHSIMDVVQGVSLNEIG